VADLDPKQLRQCAKKWRDAAQRAMLIKQDELRDAALKVASSYDGLLEVVLRGVSARG
jgi:hypothetical protein